MYAQRLLLRQQVGANIGPTAYRAAILPCTPLAIVKTLEYLGVYNNLLPYGQRAYGRVITVINR